MQTGLILHLFNVAYFNLFLSYNVHKDIIFLCYVSDFTYAYNAMKQLT